MDCHQGQCKGGGAEGNGNDDCGSGDRCLCELDGLDGNAVVRRHAWQPTEAGPDVILATTNQARDRIDEKRYYISKHKCYDRECVKERTKSLIVYLAGLRTYP